MHSLQDRHPQPDILLLDLLLVQLRTGTTTRARILMLRASRLLGRIA